MNTKQILPLAALAALLPMSGALAQNNSGSGSGAAMTAGGGAGTMDVGEFRGNLGTLRDHLNMMRENSNLALSSPDALISSSYEQKNARLLTRALGLTTRITANWKRMDTPDTNVNQMGTRDMARFAAESDDTAFVRNTVWQIAGQLQAAKLNGRNTGIVSSEMSSMLDAAIARAENPNFRVASAGRSYSGGSSRRIEWNDNRSGGDASASASGGGEQVASTRREWREVTLEHENLPARDRVAMATPAPAGETMETTTIERTGSADLPRTGGNPGMFLMLGSGLAGLGGLLLRKRRS